MVRLEMKNYNMILIENLPKYQLYHQAKLITSKDILPSNQQQIIGQAKYTYSPLGKTFEKRIKTIEDQGEKQIKTLEYLNQKNKQRQLRVNVIINQ